MSRPDDRQAGRGGDRRDPGGAAEGDGPRNPGVDGPEDLLGDPGEGGAGGRSGSRREAGAPHEAGAPREDPADDRRARPGHRPAGTGDDPGGDRTPGPGGRRAASTGPRVDGLEGIPETMREPPRRPTRPAEPERPDPELLDEILATLASDGFDEAEAYAKRGRSRRLSLEPHHPREGSRRAVSFHDERGWAVRAGTPRASFFACGSGPLPPEGPWPEPDGLPIRLPDPDAAGSPAPWTEPADFETPLIGETEGLRLLEAVERSLADELGGDLAGVRLLSAWLEDGSSQSHLASRRGVRASWRLRVAVLRAEAAARGRDGDPVRAVVHLAAREARRFGPAAVARQLADRLAVAAAGTPEGFPGRDRGDLLLAPAVGARLLAALAPLLVGSGAADRLEPLRDRRGRIASERLTVIDDGRLPGGVLAAPVDGEGVATRAVTLVEEGAFRQPLISWRAVHARTRGQARSHASGLAGAPPEGRPTGCARRASWRDVPQTAPTHLYVDPAPSVAPAELLADLARGYYLVDATGPARVDWERGTFRVPVLGFAVQGGRARGPVAGVELAGSLRTLLRGIQGVARDLTFFPLDGMVGAPTLRLTGLELRRSP